MKVDYIEMYIELRILAIEFWFSDLKGGKRLHIYAHAQHCTEKSNMNKIKKYMYLTLPNDKMID